MPHHHEWPNIYIWLCKGKNALFTNIHIVMTGCTGKLLQGEMCQSSINKTTRPIMKIVYVVAMAFNLPASYVYIYIAIGVSQKSTGTCRTNFMLLLQAFLDKIPSASLVIRRKL